MSVAPALPEPAPHATAEAERRPAAQAAGPDVVRPVQYLGNKQRSLGPILSAISGLIRPGDAAADLFSGTSVVSQALAALDLSVTAVDVSPACAEMARATLGVGRGNGLDSRELLTSWREASAQGEDVLISAFAGWIQREREALAARDGKALIGVGREVPQVWRSAVGHPATDGVFEAWHEAARCRRATTPLLSPVVAGSYLGIEQAIKVDARRQAITQMAKAGQIDDWQASTMVTALLAATSAAAFSPGKHFAQPHRTDDSKDLGFHCGRIIVDRSVDIDAVAERWLEQLENQARWGRAHEVLQLPVDSVDTSKLVARGIRLVYADPPYTAQQYSRFYHVLDTLADGRPSPLQLHRGSVTSGLYPDNRYLSPYCSKRQAPKAFSQLAGMCRAADATLVFSYSTSAAGSTGNQRMISLDELCRVLVGVYGPAAVEVTELDHGYRQFNHRDSARQSRDDPEVLVIAHAP